MLSYGSGKVDLGIFISTKKDFVAASIMFSSINVIVLNFGIIRSGLRFGSYVSTGMKPFRQTTKNFSDC